MKFDITRLRLWPPSAAAWVLLILFLLPTSESVCASALEITVSPSGFHTSFNLTFCQDAESLRIWFPHQSYRESLAVIGAIERYSPPYPDANPFRIWLIHQSFRLPSVSFNPRGR